ncbi:AEC family transporter [Nocardia sp. NPDC088792]|uniref:AEC family transporter n=1 Tax=Nocardia sp. NPDC088792 TaxID=3364332 RepID=UPI0037FACB97
MAGLFSMVGKLVPVAFVFSAGAVFAGRGIIAAEASKAFSEFAFRFAIPAYLMGSLYAADLRRVFNLAALGAYAATAVVSAGVVAGVARLQGHGRRETALRIMAACQVNTAYVAVPVFGLLFGDVTPIFPVILLQVCVLTTIVIAVMESVPGDGSHDAPSTRAGVPGGVWAALTTPLVLACWVGIAANVAEIPAPHWILDSLSMAGSAASPVALFALGLHLGGAGLRLRGAGRDEYWLIGFKCLAFPLLAFAIAHWGFRLTGPWLAYMVILAAMPSPQNLFIFAQTYDTEVDLAASAVVKSTIAALILLPLWAIFVPGVQRG